MTKQMTVKEVAESEDIETLKFMNDEVKKFIDMLEDRADETYRESIYYTLLHFCDEIIDNAIYVYKNEKMPPSIMQLILKISVNTFKPFPNNFELNPVFNTDISFENKNNNNHFVYIGKRLNSKTEYKIGITCDITGRTKSLKTACPDFQIIATLNTHDNQTSCRIEQGLHGSFKDQNIGGEWFNLSEEDLQWIINQFQFQRQIAKIN